MVHAATATVYVCENYLFRTMNITREGPSRRHLEMYNAVLNTGDADTRGHLQSESEKMSHFLKVVLFEV